MAKHSTGAQTKKFVMDFFKQSELSEKNGVLTVKQAPVDFETFLGKKAPYMLVFDHALHDRTKDSELIATGSYFLSAIRDYLKNKGQTTLLKAPLSFTQVDVLRYLALKKSKVLALSEEERFQALARFTFISSCQYLNKKRTSTHTLLVSERGVLNVRLPPLRAGKKHELPPVNLPERYRVAQETLRRALRKETEDIQALLREKLAVELSRIQTYYHRQTQEKDEEVERSEEKIRLLESKLRHTYYERDVLILKRLIRESEERLGKLRETGYTERLRKEEQFHLQDELNKHALALSHELVNCSLIYYPVRIYSVEVKRAKNKKGRLIRVIYDPLLKTFSRIPSGKSSGR